MAATSLLETLQPALALRLQGRPISKLLTNKNSPRHLLSIADLTSKELAHLVHNASLWRTWYTMSVPRNRVLQFTTNAEIRAAQHELLKGSVIAMMFNKRSTRTRVSTESAVAYLGGTSMFLGKEDIQLGVNESVKDTAKVISSMVQAMVVRTGAHSGIEELARESSVPVINALTDDHHPLQAIADIATMYQIQSGLGARGIEGMRIAWVGDANNVLFDLAIAAIKLGIHIHVATPSGYEIPLAMLEKINAPDETIQYRGTLSQTNVPEEAVKDADIILTDTWISMGQESEKVKRLKDFDGFQVTEDLAKRGGANPNWKFMHCLPRHAEEVSDEVFYHPERSHVFPEAQNRLFAMLAVLDTFVLESGFAKQMLKPLSREEAQAHDASNELAAKVPDAA